MVEATGAAVRFAGEVVLPALFGAAYGHIFCDACEGRCHVRYRGLCGVCIEELETDARNGDPDACFALGLPVHDPVGEAQEEASVEAWREERGAA